MRWVHVRCRARHSSRAVSDECIACIANAGVADGSCYNRFALKDWSPDSWKSKPNQQPFHYEDAAAARSAVERLRKMPPLVTSWEIERLRELLAEAQLGRRFLLQGGDCAETFADCTPAVITNKLKILLQMSLVL